MHRRLAATRAAAAPRITPRVEEPVVPPATPPAPPPVAPESGLEHLLIEILRAPADQTLTVREAYARKEQALCDVIAAAPFIEVWMLHKRVTIGRSDDQLVAALQRLSPERRTKVIAFMADARRRDALRAS